MGLSILIFTIAAVLSLGSVFPTEEKISIPADARVSAEGGWTFWNYCAISPGGDEAAFIDPVEHRVFVFFFGTESTRTAARHSESLSQAFHFSVSDIESFEPSALVSEAVAHGRAPNKVELPISVAYSSTGDLLVSDVRARRLLTFDSVHALKDSFVLTGMLTGPNEIKVLPDGNLLVADFEADNLGMFNAGYYCFILSPQGEILKRFAYTPESALERKLWTGLSATFDFDGNDRIYVAFSTEGWVYVYDLEGRLVRRMNCTPSWFIEPEALPEPDRKIQSPPTGYQHSWARIIDLIYLGSDKLLLVAETNNMIPGVDEPFIMDLLTIDGEIIRSGIVSEHLPVGLDDDGFVYFLSFQGDHLLRTTLLE